MTPNYGATPRDSADGVTVRRVPFPRKLAPGQAAAPSFLYRNPLWTAYFAYWIVRVAQTERIDVIHVQGKAALVASWLAARWLRRPVVATIRDLGLICPLGFCTLFEPWETFDCSTFQYVSKCAPYFLKHYEGRASHARRVRLWFSLRLAWVAHRFRRWALARVDGVVGVSYGILAIYPERIVPRDRRRAVYSLPPAAAIPTADETVRVRRELGIGDRPLVLYAGKLSLGKGTPVFLKALDRIRSSVSSVRFVVAGKGELTLPVRDDLHALGVLDQAALFRLYRAADIVVVPSVWPEPLSRVIVEAMHFGRPVVATSVGGSPEAVEDGVTGLLVPKDDDVALAEAVVALLRDPARRERMGVAARARVAAVFGEDKVIALLLDAYAAATRRSV